MNIKHLSKSLAFQRAEHHCLLHRVLWWLVLRGGGAVIVEGESIAHARLLAVMNELGRASQFDEGYPIDPDLAAMIPEDFIFRKLFPRKPVKCSRC